MEIQLLGQVALWNADGTVPLGTPRRRCVFAVLAMTPGQPVPIESLVDRVWGEQPPQDVRSVLYSHVSRLRGALKLAGSPGTVVRAGGGYVLDVPPDRVDLHRARLLVAEVRRGPGGPAGEAAGSDQARVRLRAAYELLSRAPLAGLAGAWVERSRHALAQERLAVATDLFEAELRLGRHAAVVGELAGLHAEHPLAEGLAGILMRALYRSGRLADALTVYSGIRRQLVDEIGDEPGPELRRLHEQILRRDRDLDADGPAPVAGGGDDLEPPMQLPADVPVLVGREELLGLLDRLVADRADGVVVVALDGLAGVGKTALAVHWGHRAQERFPGGQLYVDLRGHATQPPLAAAEVLARFLRALHVPPHQLPTGVDEAAARYRSAVAGKRILLVLDDATDPDQVRPLLPGGAGSVVLVTSRNHLAGLVARDGAHRTALGPLPREASVALLAALLGGAGVEAAPATVDELARWCGDLPLALQIAAANAATAPGLRLDDYLARLRDSGRLAALAVPGDERTAVAGAFDHSYLRLPPPARRLLRRLSLLPGRDVTAEVAAAAAGTTVADADGTLRALAVAHLLDSDAGRYRFHDLVRAYAADRADRDETDAGRRAAFAGACGYYLRAGSAAAATLYPESVRLPDPEVTPAPEPFPDRVAAESWLEAERTNLVGYGVRAAAAGQPATAWRLADLLRSYLIQRSYLPEGRTLAGAALAAAEAAGDRSGQAAALLTIAGLAEAEGRYEESAGAARRARALAGAAGWAAGEAVALRALGVSQWQLGRAEAAIGFHQQALAHSRTAGWRHGEAAVANSLGVIHLDRGELRSAAALVTQSLAAHRELGFTYGVASNHATLGEIYRYLGDYRRALRSFAAARARFREIGERNGVANSLRGYAAVLGDLGRGPERAAALARRALATYRDTGHRRLEADALNTLAGVEVRTDPRSAGASYRFAIRLASEGHYRFLEAEALVGLAAAEHRLGAVGPADAHAHRALGIAEGAGYRLLVGQAHVVLARNRLRSGAPAEAGAEVAQALASYRGTDYRPGEAAAHRVGGEAAHAIGDRHWTNYHRRAAHAIVAGLGASEGAGVSWLTPAGPSDR